MIGVTGASGFVGRHAVQYLLEHGYDIKIFQQGEDPTHFASTCDVVLNCAGVSRSKDEADFFEGNVEFVRQLSLAEKHLINLSSVQAGKPTFYGKTKLQGEKFATVSLRCPGMYGPLSKPNYTSVVATWIANAIQNDNIRVFQNKLFPLLYVRDLLTILKCFIDDFLDGRVYSERQVFLVQPTTIITLVDLAHCVKSVCRSASKIIVEEEGLDLTGPLLEGMFCRGIDIVSVEDGVPLMEGLKKQYEAAL